MTRRWWPAPVVALALVGAACSSGSSSTSTVASAPVSAPSSAVAVGDPPLVDQIMPAVAAVEAALGGPQDLFEVNATSRLVNVIVALNAGTMAQSWVYLDGALSSRTAEPAQGHTFTAAALRFDPTTVLAQVQHDLPESSIDLFFVEGGANGAVRLTALVTSSSGGQLQVVVDPDGKVLQVESN